MLVTLLNSQISPEIMPLVFGMLHIHFSNISYLKVINILVYLKVFNPLYCLYDNEDKYKISVLCLYYWCEKQYSLLQGSRFSPGEKLASLTRKVYTYSLFHHMLLLLLSSAELYGLIQKPTHRAGSWTQQKDQGG